MSTVKLKCFLNVCHALTKGRRPTLHLSMSLYRIFGILLASLSCSAQAEFDGEDVHLPSLNTDNVAKTFFSRFTVLNYDVKKKEEIAISKFSELIALKEKKQIVETDDVIEDLVNSFLNTPYGHGEGEGRWCGINTRGCAHIQELPLFRTDILNCQTFVQSGLALVQSHSLEDFKTNFIAVKYGAADHSNQINYFNRNNFVSASLNVNLRRIGFTAEPLYSTVLAGLQETSSALITRNNWFAKQSETDQKLRNHVMVQNENDGEAMANRFSDAYPHDFASFQPIIQPISYLPKAHFFTVDNNSGEYTVKTDLFEALPTPAIVEVIRDPKKWLVGGAPISQVIGSELNVSHMGFLHKKRFKHLEEITTLIKCHLNNDKQKVCVVNPLLCNEKKGCDEVMFSHATSAYPNGYFFFRDKSGSYHCASKLPDDDQLDQGFSPTSCNRVVSMPLGNYMLSEMYGGFPFLDSDSILGVHLEKIRWDP